MPGPTTLVDKITSKVSGFIGLNGTRKTAAEGFDINRFSSEIQTYGIEPTNLFLVMIQPTLNSSDVFSSEKSKMIPFFCHRAILPGRNIIVDENITRGIGPAERFAHNAVSTDIGLSFFGDEKGQILQMFMNWTDSIVPTQSKNKDLNNYYKANYKDDYVATMEIYVFDRNSNKIIKYKLRDVFPYTINQIPMSWADQNNFMSIDISFYYTDYDIEFPEVPEDNTDPGQLSLLQKALKLGNVIRTVLPPRKPTGVADAINIVNNASIAASTVSDIFRR